jgi:hypothetical protein
MLQAGDLLGDGVNVAARLQSAAEPGGICISGSVYDQIRNKLSLTFKPLGDLSFKNIPHSVRTFAIAGAEETGALPLPERQRIRSSRGFPMWSTLAAVLLSITAGATFWVYSEHERQAEILRQAQHAAERTAAEQGRREKRAAEEEARQRAAAGQQAADAARQMVQAEQQLSEDPPATPPAPKLAALQPDTPRGPPAASLPGRATDPSGIYRGQICYGPSPADPARCYTAQAIVQNSQISGQWPGRNPGVTMYLAGHISPSSEVAIHMHGERADGSRFGVADLAGTLEDERIDASGDFLNGRHVKLNWHRN